MLATVAIEASRNRQRRVGEGAYMDGVESGQRLFAILFRKQEISAEPTPDTALVTPSDMGILPQNTTVGTPRNSCCRDHSHTAMVLDVVLLKRVVPSTGIGRSTMTIRISRFLEYDESASHLGEITMIMASALVALVAQSTAPVLPVPDAEGFPATRTEIIDLDQDKARRMTTPVMIGEHGPFDFLIDTASQATVLSDTVNDAVKLPSDGMATIVGMASRVPVELVQLDGLRIGGRTVDGLSAPVLNREHVGADGIIGLDILEDVRVLFDFRNETIAVYEEAEAPSRRGYEIVVRARPNRGRMILTDATVGGVRTKVVVDTGAQSSIGNLKLRERLRNRIQSEGHAIDVNGAKIEVELERARTLKIGEIGLENVIVAYADAPIFHELELDEEPALILGMAELRAFDRVAIDFATRKVMFDIPGRYRKGSGIVSQPNATRI